MWAVEWKTEKPFHHFKILPICKSEWCVGVSSLLGIFHVHHPFVHSSFAIVQVNVHKSLIEKVIVTGCLGFVDIVHVMHILSFSFAAILNGLHLIGRSFNSMFNSVDS